MINITPIKENVVVSSLGAFLEMSWSEKYYIYILYVVEKQ